MSNRYKGGVISATPPTTTGGEDGTASGAWTLEQQMQLQAAGLWPSQPINYIEEVFSTYLYTGSSSTQTITNGIDLTGKGGMIWLKQRGGGSGSFVDHWVFDTVRGAGQGLRPNLTNANYNGTGDQSFTSSGFVVGNTVAWNESPAGYASWTFREQPKFFDVVTYTGTGSARTIAHNLGSVPGCIIVKRTDSANDWWVYHRSLGNEKAIYLDLTNAAAFDSAWNNTDPTSTVFSVGSSSNVNASGGTYVAYLFAHNAGGFGLTGTDNVISCGSFTTDASGNGTFQNLGYEPQWMLVKSSSTAEDWVIDDVIRGMFATAASSAQALYPNQTYNESLYGVGASVSATGFTGFGSGSQTYIYVAIRRGPMAVPTTSTTLFAPVAYTGTNVDNRLVNTGIVTDMTMARGRNNTSAGGFYVADRLRNAPFLGTATTTAEGVDADSFMTPTLGYGGIFAAMNGFGVGNDITRALNQSGTNQLAYAFKRAPGFFDEVCYTGTGSATTVTHNLGAVPELMIVKGRSTASAWEVYHVSTGASYFLELNYDTGVQGPYSPGPWNGTTPTSTVFSLPGTGWQTNNSGVTYVAYLFATLAGVSKVGSYTGTGTTQQINCGFTGGARFVLIKRTDSTGGWYVWDSARGIVSGNDPYLLLNSTSSENTTDDFVDTYSAGFELSSTAPAALNASGGTFIFLAIA